MCIRDSDHAQQIAQRLDRPDLMPTADDAASLTGYEKYLACLLYTSDAADERSSVDLGGRRIIKKKNTLIQVCRRMRTRTTSNTPQ